MKIIYRLLASSFFLLLLFSSCKKGATGPQGLTGATGATGGNGANGASGNTMLSGNGIPTIALGNVGDFYLETDSSKLYGPKTAAGWGSPVSLVGASGTSGTPGTPGALVDTFTVTSANWTVGGYANSQESLNTGTGFPAQYLNRFESNLTKGILDSGMVLVYFTPDSAFNPNQWLPMPYTIPAYAGPTSTLVDYNWSYITSQYLVTLQFYLTPLSATTTLPGISSIYIPNGKYKIVIVPGTIAYQIVSISKKKFIGMGKVFQN